MRLFYVIYPEDKRLQVYLDALRLIINPTEKRLTHVTVRGPIKKHYSKIELQHWNAIIDETSISVNGVGFFFNQNQNTVFLKCESSALKEIWKKSEYGYNPHITLYDGNLRDQAVRLLEILNKYNYNFTFPISSLSPLISIRGQQDFDIKFSINEDLKIVSDVIQETIDFSQLDRVPETKRLLYINRLCRHISLFNTFSEQRTIKTRASQISIAIP
ncbi:MAG: hypothetical protein P9X24_13735 [Candidatus Hatepunaea meridiana]|nr:hypothetical protein [Candidatus Hatepunaea meridiana]